MLNNINQKPNGNDLTKKFESVKTELKKIIELMESFNCHNMVTKDEILKRVTTIKGDIDSMVPYYPLSVKVSETETKSINQEFAAFKLNVENSIAKIKNYVLGVSLLNIEIINYLVQKTEGLCNGDIENISKSIQKRLEENSDRAIGKSDIDLLVEPFFGKIAKEREVEQKKIDEEAKTKERQKIEDKSRKMINITSQATIIGGGAIAGSVAASVVPSAVVTAAAGQAFIVQGALAKTGTAMIAAWNPIIAKTVAVKAASVTIGGKAAIAALIPGVQAALLVGCIGVGAWSAYKYFVEE